MFREGHLAVPRLRCGLGVRALFFERIACNFRDKRKYFGEMSLPNISSKFICKHSGVGTFQSPSFVVKNAEFEFGVLPWGETHIRLSSSKDISGLSDQKGIPEQYGTFSGATKNGFEITASNMFPDNISQCSSSYSSSTKKTEVLLTGETSSVIQLRETLDVVSLQFYLVNFTISGTDWFVEDENELSRAGSEIHLELDHFDVRLRPVSDYSEITEILEHTRGMDVTCHVLVSNVPASQIGDVVNMVEKLCLLLSLARGTRVSYPRFDIISPEKPLLVSHYHACRKSTFHHSAPIDYVKRIETKTFLQQAYPRIDQAFDDWGVDGVIDMYVDSKFESEYINARGIKTVICMEMLRAKFMQRRNSGEFIIGEGLFSEKKEELQKKIRSILSETFPEVDSGSLDLMSFHSQGLNYYTFRRSINEMCEAVGFSVSKSDISRFVKIRNKLVHSGSYESEQMAFSDHKFIDWFVGKFVLATLGYIEE